MKKLITTSILTLALIACLLIRSSPKNILIINASGSPDAYGNQINWIYIEQYNVTSETWEFKGNVTTANYTSGNQVKLDALMETRFNCSVHLNSTFASSTDEAITNTRVYINITYTNGTTIIATTETTDFFADGTYDVQSFYDWDDTGNYPEAGVTYVFEVNLKTYY